MKLNEWAWAFLACGAFWAIIAVLIAGLIYVF